MHDAIRFKLHFGPYRTPRFRIGQKVQCEVLGEVTVYRVSAGRIPWPVTARRALVVYAGLARAIRKESIQAVAHHWGVSPQTVTQWRRRLGIKGEPAGTRQLRRTYWLREEWAETARRRAWAKARDPQRREKIAAAKRGKPRPKSVIDGMRRRMLGKRRSASTRRKMSAAHKARGTRPPWLNPSWEQWEDELVRRLSGIEAAKQTGRTYRP
jgi:hypothetical protein